MTKHKTKSVKTQRLSLIAREAVCTRQLNQLVESGACGGCGCGEDEEGIKELNRLVRRRAGFRAWKARLA